MSTSLSNWSCHRCTFQQSAYNDECEICGAKNQSVIKAPSDRINSIDNQQYYGRIIYQIDRFTQNELTTTYTLYLANPDIKTSTWPLFLFGDNDIDNSRPPNTDREMIGGLAGVAGKYDRSITFGVITTFYAYKPVPTFIQFKNIINRQFDTIWNTYIINGHNVIIPSPNTKDLQQHFSAFYEQINNDNEDAKYEQIIFHNIGTGIARLPLLYLKYIQYKIDNVSELSAQYNEKLPCAIVSHGEVRKKTSKVLPTWFLLSDNVHVAQEKKDDDNIDFCPNDIIEVCVNPEIDVWIDAIFLGYTDSCKNKCFLEIIKEKNDNHFMTGFDVKYIRFKQDDFHMHVDEEKKTEIEHKLVETDEWENVTDFVLKEYIRDVSDELSSDLLNSLDEFMRRMQFLGVYSAKSRSRALTILEEIQNSAKSLELAQKLEAEVAEENKEYKHRVSSQDDEFVAAEMAQRLADGHTFESFSCIRCNEQQDYGGVELRNCNHKICYKCLPQLVSSHIAMKMMPTCLKCGSVIHQTDIKVHVSAHTAEIASDIQIKDMLSKQDNLHRCFDMHCNGCIIIEDKYMKEFRCPVCNKRNCIKCKKIHNGTEQCYVPPPPKRKRPKHKANYNNYYNNYITNEDFIGNWVNLTDIKTSNMISTYDVALNSDEWNKVILFIRDPQKRQVERIQRIQHAKIWKKYWAYCQNLKHQHQDDVNYVQIGGYWHGTRTHKPNVIWKCDGFLKSKSRIGNCLWFATENTYSMNGFQHVVNSAQHQVFLALVCCGDTGQVKFIRNNKILNVYKDEATYPAYLLTYKNV